MNEYFKLELNGFEHQISIIGDENKPILLFCHGGPGTPTMSFLRNWSKPLYDMFTIVTWDQRGTGRSISRDLDKSTLNIKTIIKDTHAITDYVKKRFNINKIFIMGHSFGATVALQVIHERPEDYLAYFSVSQFINTEQNERLCYEFVLGEAQKNNDKKIIAKLEAIGPPVDGFYREPIKDLMTVKQMVSRYDGDMKGDMSTLSLIGPLFLSKEYGYHHVFKALSGIKLSLETIGLSLDGIAYDETIKEVQIPIYFFSGDYDQLTPQSILRTYYETLKAPIKELHKFHMSAHSPLWEESDKFHAIIKNIMEKHQ